MKKKFMSIMLAATCLASAPLSDGIAAYAADSTASAVTVKGDANCDGEVDMSDIVLIMQALANPNKYGENGTSESHLTAQGKTNADMDGDGLTVGDAQTIQKMLLGIDTTGAGADPLQPTTAQPISFKDTESAIAAINSGDVSSYDEAYREDYRKMFESFIKDGGIYQAIYNDAVKPNDKQGVALFPKAKYEDMGIGSYVTFKGNNYHITFYYADADVLSETDSIAQYLQKRMGRRSDKEITVNCKNVSLLLSDNGQSYAGAFIDENHYFTVNCSASEDELTEFLNVFEYEKLGIQIFVPPSEPTTYGFYKYEDYTKYIEENELADKIVTYDKLSEYGQFVQFFINYDWKQNDYFSLYYIIDDGSEKTFDIIINDIDHKSKNEHKYAELTDAQINKSDMRTASTEAEYAYYETEDKRYNYQNGKLAQITWCDSEHEYIIVGNTWLYDYPYVDNTYMAKLLDLNSSDIDNSEYLIGNESVSSAASTTQKLVLNCNSFCEKGEVLTVDMAMGDILSRQKYSDYDSEGYPNSGHHEYSIMATENYKVIDDERLLINGEKSEYTKEFTKEDMRTLDISPNIGCYDLYYHETAEIDFSDYETGSTGCITFRFGWKADEENALNAPSNFTGMEQTMYFYVGEDGVGISNNGREAAQIAYEAKSDDDIMFYDSIYVKWNGKEVMSNLYEKLRKPSDEVLAINFKLSMSPDYNFVYKGKKLLEYANANNSEYMTKLRDLMGYGPTLKYGEMVYTTGSPNGMKWTQEWYEDRVEYFGEELLSKYIVDGEFLEEQLRLDINELMKENRIANDEAEKAYYRYIANEAVKQLDKQGIRYEYMNDPKRLVIYVTSEEFKALSLDNVARYGLDISVANGLGVDAIT